MLTLILYVQKYFHLERSQDEQVQIHRLILHDISKGNEDDPTSKQNLNTWDKVGYG